MAKITREQTGTKINSFLIDRQRRIDMLSARAKYPEIQKEINNLKAPFITTGSKEWGKTHERRGLLSALQNEYNRLLTNVLDFNEKHGNSKNLKTNKILSIKIEKARNAYFNAKKFEDFLKFMEKDLFSLIGEDIRSMGYAIEDFAALLWSIKDINRLSLAKIANLAIILVTVPTSMYLLTSCGTDDNVDRTEISTETDPTAEPPRPTPGQIHPSSTAESTNEEGTEEAFADSSTNAETKEEIEAKETRIPDHIIFQKIVDFVNSNEILTITMIENAIDNETTIFERFDNNTSFIIINGITYIVTGISNGNLEVMSVDANEVTTDNSDPTNVSFIFSQDGVIKGRLAKNDNNDGEARYTPTAVPAPEAPITATTTQEIMIFNEPTNGVKALAELKSLQPKNSLETNHINDIIRALEILETNPINPEWIQLYVNVRLDKNGEAVKKPITLENVNIVEKDGYLYAIFNYTDDIDGSGIETQQSLELRFSPKEVAHDWMKLAYTSSNEQTTYWIPLEAMNIDAILEQQGRDLTGHDTTIINLLTTENIEEAMKASPQVPYHGDELVKYLIEDGNPDPKVVILQPSEVTTEMIQQRETAKETITFAIYLFQKTNLSDPEYQAVLNYFNNTLTSTDKNLLLTVTTEEEIINHTILVETPLGNWNGTTEIIMDNLGHSFESTRRVGIHIVPNNTTTLTDKTLRIRSVALTPTSGSVNLLTSTPLTKLIQLSFDIPDSFFLPFYPEETVIFLGDFEQGYIYIPAISNQ